MEDNSIISGIVSGTIAVFVLAAIGAFIERFRARSGYLSARYQRFLVTAFEDARRAQSPSSDTKAEKRRAEIEADVALFGTSNAQDALRMYWESRGEKPDKLEEAAKDLAKAWRARALRGGRWGKLTPQKRWF